MVSRPHGTDQTEQERETHQKEIGMPRAETVFAADPEAAQDESHRPSTITLHSKFQKKDGKSEESDCKKVKFHCCKTAYDNTTWYGHYYDKKLYDSLQPEVANDRLMFFGENQNFYRCGKGSPNEIDYWNSFSLRARHGQSMGNYFCDEGFGWRLSERMHMDWREPYFIAKDKKTKSTVLHWNYLREDVILTEAAVYLANAHSEGADVCILAVHPKGTTWSITGQKEQLCTVTPAVDNRTPFEWRSKLDLYFPKGTWIAYHSTIFKDNPSAETFHCRLDFRRPGTQAGTRVLRFPPLDQAAITQKNNTTTNPLTMYRSSKSFPITVSRFYVFSSFMDMSGMDVCLYWLDKNKSIRKKYCPPHRQLSQGPHQGVYSVAQNQRLNEKWIIPEGEYLAAGCTFYGRRVFEPRGPLREPLSDCAVYAYAEVPKQAFANESTKVDFIHRGIIFPEDLDSYCIKNIPYVIEWFVNPSLLKDHGLVLESDRARRCREDFLDGRLRK